MTVIISRGDSRAVNDSCRKTRRAASSAPLSGPGGRRAELRFPWASALPLHLPFAPQRARPCDAEKRTRTGEDRS